MQKLTKPLVKEYLTSKIFLEDLEKIEAIFIDAGVEDFKISTEDYRFNSIRELADKYRNQNLRELEISAHAPYLNVDFSKHTVKLYCGDDNERSTGLFYKIDFILSQVIRKPNFLYSYHTFWVASIIFLIIDLFTSVSRDHLVFYVVVRIVYAVWCGWLIYIRLFKSSDINLNYKSDVQKFFSKYKTIFTIIFTALITYFLDNIHNIYSFLKSTIS